MKIYVKASDLKRPIRLWFPTSMIKQKYVWKIIAKNSKGDKVELELIHKAINKGYKYLKQYIKVHGHFNLVEVDSSDGERIRVRV